MPILSILDTALALRLTQPKRLPNRTCADLEEELPDVVHGQYPVEEFWKPTSMLGKPLRDYREMYRAIREAIGARGAPQQTEAGE